jgi:hypothetical protein
VAAQAQVFRLIDHAHATAAQFLQDLVMRDSLTDQANPAEFCGLAILGMLD